MTRPDRPLRNDPAPAILARMALDALLLDLDGTLADTNALHVEAWAAVLGRHGFRVPPDRIMTEVGKGGDQFIPSLLGADADAEHGDAMRDGHPDAFERLAERRGIDAFPGATELIAAAKGRGLKAVLCTSSGGRSLRAIERASGVAWSDLADLVVTGDDADASKPEPDLLQAAARKAGLTPLQCAIVGDTVFDARAARFAGVACLGVTCGGNSAEALLGAGCRAVYADPADLLARLDDAIAVAAPGSARLDRATVERLMRLAIEQADAGAADGGVPIGAVLADGAGGVVGRGFNRNHRTGGTLDHAEAVAFADAGPRAVGVSGLTLVSTLEPCVMCTGGAVMAGVDAVVYGQPDPGAGGTGRVSPTNAPGTRLPRTLGGVLAGECRDRMARWLDANADADAADYVRHLLNGPGTGGRGDGTARRPAATG